HGHARRIDRSTGASRRAAGRRPSRSLGRSGIIPKGSMSKVYIAGKLVDKDQATVSVYDHGFLYGDGVFEGIRVYGGRGFRPAAHIDGLYQTARAIRLEIPMARNDLTAAVNSTVAANKLSDGYVRLVVSRGAGELGLDPRKTSHPQIIIIAD